MKLWILPIGGKGLRVKKLGKCKPLIKIKKKYIIEWFLLSIKEYIDKNDKILIVALKEDEKKFKLKKKISQILKDFFKIKNTIFKILNFKETLGPAHTIFLGIKDISYKNTTIIANPDQFIKFNFPSDEFDAFVPIYYNDNKDSSYVKLKSNYIYKIAEKRKISNNATAGYYYWNRGSDFVKYAEQMIAANDRVNNEFYVAPVYNYAIKDGKHIVITHVDKVYELGTPEWLEQYLNETRK